MKKHSKKEQAPPEEPNSPELVKRRANRKSVMRSGRTIGEAREQLETRNERNAARKKDKKKKRFRIAFTIFGFFVIAVSIACIVFNLIEHRDEIGQGEDSITELAPSVPIIDEDKGAKITSRMSTYIAQAETDFRALRYTPVKVIVPSGSIRVINFYLEGYTGFIKMTIDRGAAVSVEDADRLIRYLKGQGINDFAYLDVRLDGKAYWK
ncbi:hypothetical protein IKF28_01055 [Candidatus Saccharibacteria bacterium]|nr:hypothetical protein [Candidatus Saccharibacteria bacterium]